jgi:hypothetical protein|tara:strand:- start:611 stop:967 length:357 start_codon:yes stop_codon:yes gene_type:complete
MWIYVPHKNYKQYFNQIIFLETIYGKIITGNFAGIYISPINNKSITIRIETIIDTDLGISLSGHSHYIANDIIKHIYIDRTKQTHGNLLLTTPTIKNNTNDDILYVISKFLATDFLYI